YKSWNIPGDHIVRCVVSDMKGASASANMLVTVGSRFGYRISGWVADTNGLPLEGVRVGNGETNSATYLGSYTDSEGHYIIAGATVALTLNAYKYGFTFTNLTWTNPLAMTSDWASIDFVATAMPVVTITATTNVVSENNSTVQYFTLARSGDTTTNLTITVYLSGSANLPTDYTLTP